MVRFARPWLLLALLCVLGLLLGAFQKRYKEQGLVDPISYVVQTVSKPLQSALITTLSLGENFWQGITSAPLKTAEKKEAEFLRRRVTELEIRMEALQREVSRLRRIANFPPGKAHKTLGADILAYYPQEHRLQINRGREDGVRILAPVVTPEGLVGQIVEVSKRSSWVNLITHPEFSVGARVMRTSSQVVGLVRGQGHFYYLSLEVYNEDADVQSGDTLITSGTSEVYPEGILIGTLTQVARDPSYGVKRGVVLPAVNLNALHEVAILVPDQ